jgi:formiminotetrahydrofolate cyclodeaminase
MDWTTVGGVGATLMGIVGFFLTRLHAKIERSASRDDLERLAKDTREDINSRRKVESDLFNALNAHIAEDTRRFSEVMDRMHDQHLALLASIDRLRP